MDVAQRVQAEQGQAPVAAYHARFIFLDDRALTDLIRELSTRSLDFRIRWAAHHVRAHTTGTKHLHHPVVGELHLLFEAMEISAVPGLSLNVYIPKSGTPSEDAIKVLASWAATLPQPAETASPTEAT